MQSYSMGGDEDDVYRQDGLVEFVLWDARANRTWDATSTGRDRHVTTPLSSGFSPNHASVPVSDLEKDINAFISAECAASGYIWQCGKPLQVSLHRHGSVLFGDNMDDEWYLVYLLRRVTETFDVAAQIWDEDGEFLLIEAAYSLPDWLEPAIAANRIWIYRGTVHCIPMEVSPIIEDDNCGEAKSKIILDVSSPEKALQTLVQHTALASSCGASIEACIHRKLAGYPSLAAETMMHATACIPEHIAISLVRNPQRISMLVDAYGESLAKDRLKAVRLLDDETTVPSASTCGTAHSPQFHDVPQGRHTPTTSEAPGTRSPAPAEGTPSGSESKAILIPMVVTLNRWRYAQALYALDESIVKTLMAQCVTYHNAAIEGEGEEGKEEGTEHVLGHQQRERRQESGKAKAHAMLLGFKLSLGHVLLSKIGETDGDVRRDNDSPGIHGGKSPITSNEIPRSSSFRRDDDGWLHEPSSRVYEELDARERELDGGLESDQEEDFADATRGFNPDELVTRMKHFVSTMATMEGAVVKDEEVQLDPELFVSILRGDAYDVGHGNGAENHGNDEDFGSDDEGSSFYAMSGGEDSSDDDVTDSEADNSKQNDEENEDRQYSAAMAAQLEEELCGADQPLDVDITLVENLLASIELGQAGPADGLTGLLGIHIPKTSSHGR